jgi:hypothetical protein
VKSPVSKPGFVIKFAFATPRTHRKLTAHAIFKDVLLLLSFAGLYHVDDELRREISAAT